MQARQIYALRGIADDMEQVLTRRGIPFLYDQTGLIGRGKVSLLGLDIPLIVGIDSAECLLTLTMNLPIQFVDTDHTIAAQALCQINAGLTAGCFDLNDGAVSVRVSSFFRDSQIGTAALLNLLELCLALAEVHLVSLKRLSLREISLERFVATML